VNTTQGVNTDEFIDDKGIRHSFRYLNGAPLNDAWETLYKSIAFGIKPTVPVFNDST
jgi:hypothetical protein